VTRFSALFLPVLFAVAGCSQVGDTGMAMGNPNNCSGVVVQVNYGILGEPALDECVEFDGGSAAATDVLAAVGIETEGTEIYGDQVVCRVNGLPSATEELVVPGEDPHLETCADMPPAFAYWALWAKANESSEWDYATEGIGTLMVEPGTALGLAFSSGTDVVTPTP
jgi:hypothetical protein